MLDRRFLGLLGFSSALALFGCGASSADGGFSGGVPSASSGQEGTPGTLTAGEWDDNLNFSIYRDYVDAHLKEGQSSFDYGGADRVVITVTSEGGAPIPNALVTVADPVHTVFTAPTSTDGRVLLFPKHDGAATAMGLTLSVAPPADQQGVKPIVVKDPKIVNGALTVVLPGAAKALPKALDVAFVVDATGSMGDELEFLKSEIQGISDQVKGEFGNLSVRWSLVVYRDQGDEYVTRVFDFTPILPTFQASLADQSAGGGGDTPEAMEEAMAEVPKLSWRDGNTARLAFLVADAPPHDDAEKAYFAAVDQLRPLGVKLYPVASSSQDLEVEYVMRVGAEVTLGRYLFLTDDSGVGESHLAPRIPCFQVQKLARVVGRMIAAELSGTLAPTKPAEVIREFGSPKDGVCALQDGTEARLW